VDDFLRAKADAPMLKSFVITVTADVAKVVDGRSDLTVVSDIDIFADKIKPVEADFTVSTQLDASARVDFSAAADATVEASVEITPIRVRFNESALNIESTLFCNYDAIFDARADMSAEFTDLFTVTRLVAATADLEAQAFTLTVGDVINIDPRTQLRVLRETRRIRIAQENNTVLVPKETRILVI
jgi:hypothetical protein